MLLVKNVTQWHLKEYMISATSTYFKKMNLLGLTFIGNQKWKTGYQITSFNSNITFQNFINFRLFNLELVGFKLTRSISFLLLCL